MGRCCLHAPASIVPPKVVTIEYMLRDAVAFADCSVPLQAETEERGLLLDARHQLAWALFTQSRASYFDGHDPLHEEATHLLEDSLAMDDSHVPTLVG